MTESAESGQTGDEADRNAILELLDRWRRAESARDIHALLTLLDDDIVFLPSSVPPIQGVEAVGEMYRAYFPLYREITHEATIEELRISGPWAFLWGSDELRMTPASGGDQIHRKGMGLSILKRQPDGSWRFWRGINNITQAPRER